MIFDYGRVPFHGNCKVASDAERVIATMTRFRFSGKRTLMPGWLLALFVAPPLQAVNPNLFLDQYLHTSWTQKEGTALPPIQALAQTADGYLWLGTSKGLMRFDGMRFTDWSPASGPPLPSPNIGWLRPASTGGLWVGTTAGLCRVDRCRVIRYPSLSKLPCPVIVSMWEDRTGALWLLNGCPGVTTVAVLSPDGNLRTFGTRDGLPEQHPFSLFQDRQEFSGSLHPKVSAAGRRGARGYAPKVLCSMFRRSASAARNKWQWQIATATRSFVFRKDKQYPWGRRFWTRHSPKLASATVMETFGSARWDKVCCASGRMRWTGLRAAKAFPTMQSRT
jgi:hypothetical protein